MSKQKYFKVPNHKLQIPIDVSGSELLWGWAGVLRWQKCTVGGPKNANLAHLACESLGNSPRGICPKDKWHKWRKWWQTRGRVKINIQFNLHHQRIHHKLIFLHWEDSYIRNKSSIP